jgi:hypothetical protein
MHVVTPLRSMTLKTVCIENEKSVSPARYLRSTALFEKDDTGTEYDQV